MNEMYEVFKALKETDDEALFMDIYAAATYIVNRGCWKKEAKTSFTELLIDESGDDTEPTEEELKEYILDYARKRFSSIL